MNYGDILGLVFQTCRRCRKNRLRQSSAGADDEQRATESTVSEVMTSAVIACKAADDRFQIMESLSAHRMSAVLVSGQGDRPAGVISKTDLIVAWHRGVPPGSDAAAVMSKPVISCDWNEVINQALARMLLGDMGRIFVHDGGPDTIVGVLSLSDAANHRSGTCRACVSSRMVS